MATIFAVAVTATLNATTVLTPIIVWVAFQAPSVHPANVICCPFASQCADANVMRAVGHTAVIFIVHSVPVPPDVALPVPVVNPVPVPACINSTAVTTPQGAIAVTITCAPVPPTEQVRISPIT